MPMLPDLEEIRNRAKALNLTLTQVARAGGHDPSVILNWAKGKTFPRVSTIRAFDEALCAEEARVREHLAKLPKPEPEKPEPAKPEQVPA